MKFYFLCITQPFNVGDLVINKMLIDELCTYGTVFVDAYHTPDSFKKEIVSNSNAVDLFEREGFSAKRLNLIKLSKFIRKEKISFYVSSPGPIEGGNYLYSCFILFIRWIFRISGARVFCIGGCCSSLISKRKKFHRCFVDHYYMRSQASVNYINMKNEGLATYIPDLSFLMKYHFSNVDDHLYEDSKRVLISFRDVDSDSFFLWCKSVITALCESRFKVTLFYQVESDKSFMARLFESTREIGVFYRESIVWYQDLSFYSHYDVVISNRLHVFLIAAILGKKPIAAISDASLTSKLKDVIASSFYDYSTLVVPYYSLPDTFIDKIKSIDGSTLSQSVKSSAALCRETIHTIVSDNNK